MHDRAPHLRGLVGRTEAAACIVQEFIESGLLRFTVNGERLKAKDVEVREDPLSMHFDLIVNGQVLATISDDDLLRISHGPGKKRDRIETATFRIERSR